MTFSFNDCPVDILQSEWEFGELLARYRALAPRRVLEIGALAGGTLWYWMQNTEPGAEFVVIDLPIPWHKFWPQQKAGHNGLWQQWAAERGHTLTIIPGLSHENRDKVSGQFDFIFIDADHTTEAVTRDFNLYADLARPGGLIALHDIDMPKGNPHYGVQPFWRELKYLGYGCEELIGKPGWQGIGVVHVAEPEAEPEREPEHDGPFLSIVTRCYQRPTMLAKNKRSVSSQTDKDYEHLFIVDEEGAGLLAANRALATARPGGEYVLVLDDDNRITDTRMIEALKEAAIDRPALVFFKSDHSPTFGTMPHDVVWGKEPKRGHVDSANFITRRDWWERHIEAFGVRLEGDYEFLAAMWKEKPDVAWLDRQMIAVQRISKGKPECEPV